MNIMLLSVSVWSGADDMAQETRDFFHWLSALIALPAAAYAGQPFFRSAWRAIRARAAQHGRADLARRVCSRSACRWSRPRSMPSTPTSIPPRCCCSSCCADARSTTRCGARPARSPAISRRSRPTSRIASTVRELVRVPAAALQSRTTGCWCGRAIASRPTVSCFSGTSEIDDSLVTGETAAPRGRGRSHAPRRRGELLRHAHDARDGGRKRHADRRSRAAAREGRHGEIALRASGRPRGADLCAGRACDRGADARRLAGRRRVGARCDHHGDRRADHHLPVRAGAWRSRRCRWSHRVRCSAPA